MGAMTAQEVGIYTEDDLESFRSTDARLRFEVIDGELFVNPSPGVPPQLASIRLAELLLAAHPPEFQIFTAPLDVRLAHDTVVQPDLLVVTWDNLDGGGDLEPVLAVEIPSPSTRRADLVVKWDRLARAGCPSYWVVDPLEPSLRAWELRDGVYRLAAEASGEQTARLTQPFPVEVTPSALVARPGAS